MIHFRSVMIEIFSQKTLHAKIPDLKDWQKSLQRVSCEIPSSFSLLYNVEQLIPELFVHEK